MTPEGNDILDEFLRRELTTMEIFLLAKASRASISIEEYIDTRILQGASPESIEAFLLDDLNNNGRIFGEFRNAIRATANGVISRSRDNAMFADPEKTIAEEEFRWVAVLINTCQDCLDRHGQSKTYGEWEMEGLPRTGATVCKENCKCMLLPAKTAVLDPIMRGRK
jgi:hypothetical protein